MQVRSLEFKKRKFVSKSMGGVYIDGNWWIAKSVIGNFEIHTFKGREDFILFWPNNRRGVSLHNFDAARSRADYEYEKIILAELLDTDEGLTDA